MQTDPIQSFRIDVKEDVLTDLTDRLRRTRWPTQIDGTGWTYGVSTRFLKDFCEFWAEEYDWRTHEAALNRIPQYRIRVDEIDLHVLWIRGTQPSIPLLLIHGWPGSIAEYTNVIDALSRPRPGVQSFDLVIPSLPGFGFSSKPRRPGWGADRIAATLHRLMKTLGYERYGVQGGDWGTILGTRMAMSFPDSLLGLHINMPFAYPPAENDADTHRFAALMQAETAYLHVQNTKPDALTLAQTDSPAGLAAWVLEKFRAWSDCGGELTNAFTREQLATNLMFYWAPESISSAARIYFESAACSPPLFRHPRISVRTGVACLPREPYRVPRSWLDPLFNIVSWTDMPRGGHFAAMEIPDLLVDDVRTFFTPVGSEAQRF